MQPLDTSVFGPLKAHWRNACHHFTQKFPNKVITKYLFSPLLNEAWCQTMIPSSIINGFKYCGVHPFNPQIILDRSKVTTAATSDSINVSTTPNSTRIESSLDTEDRQREIVFSLEEEAKFEKRYDEGYDLFDERYELWLQKKHPKDDGILSFDQEFSYVPACEPVCVLNNSNNSGSSGVLSCELATWESLQDLLNQH